MSLPQTETLPDHESIDAVSTEDAVRIMLDGQAGAIEAVRRASADLIRASDLMTEAVRGGGALIYAAAGSSGLMALADGSELTGTFGIPAEQLGIHMAGGVPVDGAMPGDVEDDAETAGRIAISAADVVIILSASGTTPYALAVAAKARQCGARIIGIANNPGTPLSLQSDVAICLETPPEIIAGSTRLGAGTAQKAALNAMSTLMGVRLGHVHQGMMVNLVADNAKLRNRATGIVRSIAQVTEAEARAALEAADGQVKLGALIAAGHSADEARALLAKHDGHLGPCLKTTRTN